MSIDRFGGKVSDRDILKGSDMKKFCVDLLLVLAVFVVVCASGAQEDMTREQKNKLIVRVAIQAINEGDWQTLSEVYSPRFVQHGPGDTKQTTWTDFELGCRIARQKMPTVRLEIEDIIAEGDKVAVRLKTIVTYKVNPHGIKITAEKKEFREMDLFRIEDGRIVEEWSEYDTKDWKTKLWQLKSKQEQLRFEWR